LLITSIEKEFMMNVATVKTIKTYDILLYQLQNFMTKCEEWRTMKIVILGNGRIGKTTFIQHLLKLHDKVCYFIMWNTTNTTNTANTAIHTNKNDTTSTLNTQKQPYNT
jgi:GTPase SAR1 family protein